MTTHIEIVSVTYRRGKAGERTACNFEDYAINRPHPDDWAEDLPLYDWAGRCFESWPPPADHPGYGTGAYLDLPTDWYGFRFQFFGQFFEHQQSALEYECECASAEDTFGDFAESLRAIGDKLLDGRAKEYEPPREVTFLTAWTWTSSQCYEGEWDHEWDLLGLIDLSKIKTLIVPASAPQEVSCQPQ